MTLTPEQHRFAEHTPEAFVEACPGAGKTRTIVARLARIATTIPPRKGVALLSFTNSAVEEFIERCHVAGLDQMLKHPGFVGTFDAFVRQFFIAPSGIDGVDIRPTVIDSWDTLGIDVRLRGRSAFRGQGVSLDYFDSENNRINADSVGHNALRTHVRANETAYIHAAEQRRRGLRGKGYLSAADARVEACKRLQDNNWSLCLGRALAARFQEVIVDEAQDCNPLDLQILRWLRDSRLPVVIVSDPDQSIYGFRHGDPANLRQFAEHYVPANRLSLTGNFRSSPPICALASTLRSRNAPDASLGEHAAVDIPVHLFEYHGNSVPSRVGEKFVELVEQSGLQREAGIVLAHSRRAAWRAAGYAAPSDDGGESNIAAMARQVGALWSSSASNRTRETALRTVEKMVLKLMGRIESDEIPARAAERHGMNARWLRRTALELIMRLPRSCDDSDAGRASWVTTLHEETDRLRLQYAANTSARRYFPQPRRPDWSKHLQQSGDLRLGCSTIHEAKGRQYDAVCVVVPPDRGDAPHTSRLLDAWETRANDEAKRVIYVGVTRARKLLSVAVPTALRDRLTAILNHAGVPIKLHDLSP